jgi:hypothetical protein
MIDFERWKTLSKRDQLGHIASEIRRAIETKGSDKNIYSQILERALELVDLSLDDQKWRDNPLPLLILRNEIAKVYIGENINLEKVYAAL